MSTRRAFFVKLVGGILAALGLAGNGPPRDGHAWARFDADGAWREYHWSGGGKRFDGSRCAVCDGMRPGEAGWAVSPEWQQFMMNFASQDYRG